MGVIIKISNTTPHKSFGANGPKGVMAKPISIPATRIVAEMSSLIYRINPRCFSNNSSATCFWICGNKTPLINQLIEPNTRISTEMMPSHNIPLASQYNSPVEASRIVWKTPANAKMLAREKYKLANRNDSSTPARNTSRWEILKSASGCRITSIRSLASGWSFSIVSRVFGISVSVSSWNILFNAPCEPHSAALQSA